MNRMSARFFGSKLNISTQEVYSVWEDMGIVVKNKIGDWIVTEAGTKIGGRSSKGFGVPTFDFDSIKAIMLKYMKNCHK